MFSSSSEVGTFVFLSGLSFQYIHKAAFRTVRSKRDSDAKVHTSSLFSAVMPSKEEFFAVHKSKQLFKQGLDNTI